MSLVRAFTTRMRKPADLDISGPNVGRAASQRNGRPVLRAQISSPVALVSTTNMLSYEAPDINGTTPIGYRDFSSASSASSNSGEDSDASSNSVHSNDTVTDMSSLGPDSPTSPEPNHLSCYFKPAVETTHSSPTQSPHLCTTSAFDAPVLPQRALSHSKKAHEALSRKRSVQRMQSPPGSARTSTELYTPSLDSCVEARSSGPFGKELAQLDEVAEEFGNTVCGVQADADTQYMTAHNLAVFGASDYLGEIHSLIYATFAEEPEVAAWF